MVQQVVFEPFFQLTAAKYCVLRAPVHTLSNKRMYMQRNVEVEFPARVVNLRVNLLKLINP